MDFIIISPAFCTRSHVHRFLIGLSPFFYIFGNLSFPPLRRSQLSSAGAQRLGDRVSLPGDSFRVNHLILVLGLYWVLACHSFLPTSLLSSRYRRRFRDLPHCAFRLAVSNMFCSPRVLQNAD